MSPLSSVMIGTTARRLGVIGLAWLVFVSVSPATGLAQDKASQTDSASDPDLDFALDADAEAEAAVAQAALDSELASAKRFEDELEALLRPDGQLDTAQDDGPTEKLASLATRCGILANSAMHDEVRLVLLGYQARAFAALASLEQATAKQDGTDRLEQLAEVARQIGEIALPGAKPAADYWVMLAAIASPAPDNEPNTQRQTYVEWALENYIADHRAEDHAAEYVLDARLSLAVLMDRRGAQRDAAKLLEQIGELPPDSPRQQDAAALRDSIGRHGTPIRFESISTELTAWRSSDHFGKPVLVHVYADSVDPSVRMIDVITRSIVEGSLSGIAVVSLRVGDPIASKVSPPWPTLPVQLEPEGVLDQLGVTALPTLAWLDDRGRLASIGTTAAVLDQLAFINPDEPNESDEPDKREQAEQSPEPVAEPATQPAAEQEPESPTAEDQP